MNLAQMIQNAKAEAAKPAKAKTIKPINPVVNKLLTERICITYKDATRIAIAGGAKSFHTFISGLSKAGLGADAQLLVMTDDGEMPKASNQTRMQQFGHSISGYTPVPGIKFLEIIQQALAEEPAEAPAPPAPAAEKSNWLLV